ncbi:Similar to Uncharacterized protein L696; acc. no. Q5UNV9 [Pyronema omphalodes CBS 100304]|uniref:Similar to Uncharacterized protein L696 acc. no. Q5UNV9 n=1 Tax=Pyronema omphalodes (strain CBS 100304) TaxID=1076935 RepID=U4L7A3_PYROM|nr:Similar to Uncharacterized protein L696; acc. no. Q5UNV9 [Pyronema omphalodes CBS 100304]
MSENNHCHMDIATMDREELQARTAATMDGNSLANHGRVSRMPLRSLHACGDDQQLAFTLAVHDLAHRTDLNAPRLHTPPPTEEFSSPELVTSIHSIDSLSHSDALSETSVPHPAHAHLPTLPPELWADIFEFVDDWELATALGVHTNLRPTQDWDKCATALDRVLLSGSVSHASSFLARHPTQKFTKFGAKALIRFSYVDLLTFLRTYRPMEFSAVFSENSCQIPVLASRFGQTQVLNWWLQASDPKIDDDPLPRDYNSEPLDEASRKGHIHVLQWWKSSGLPLRYGLVMDVASAAGQIQVLEWWKSSSLPLEYDANALKCASYRGQVGVLEWWKQSGLKLIYDQEILTEATKFNRVEVLEWWKKSGLTVQYLLMDVEAALEDAIGGGKEAMEWWTRQGVRFDVTVREWMECKVL